MPLILLLLLSSIGFAASVGPRDPWPDIQKLKALTALDIQDQLVGEPIVISGTVEDIYEEDMNWWVTLRGNSKAATIDFKLYGDQKKLKGLQRLNQRTGADTFTVIAKVTWVRKMDSSEIFVAEGKLLDYSINPPKKTQVPAEGKEGYNLNQ